MWVLKVNYQKSMSSSFVLSILFGVLTIQMNKAAAITSKSKAIRNKSSMNFVTVIAFLF